MADGLSITLEDHDTKGRYVATLPDMSDLAEMTYSRVNAKLIIVDHTGVPDAMAGKGVAKALARHVIEEARAKGFKIIPLCPFLKAQADKHPEWSDVIQS